jgi:YbbR domain-containing protein
MIIFTRNLVVKDFWLKLFSLALATLIWLTVWFSTHGENATSPWLALIGRPPNESVLTVPIRVPFGTTDPAQVTITLRGDSQILKSLKPENIRAEVDLTGVESASGLLRPVEIILPKGIFYTRLEPDEVAVQFSSNQK